MAIFIQCNEYLAECGEVVAECGNSYELVTGTIIITEDDDTLIGVGVVADISGTIIVTEDDDTLVGVGIVGDINGTIITTEDDDTLIGIINIAIVKTKHMISFLNIFKHLLPNALAWKLTPDKFLRKFFTGLANSDIATGVKAFFDNIFSDIDPQQTRELAAWETQFGLPNTGQTEQERRDRLEAAWKAVGGQDPRYIQDTLQAAGFDVYVHEWWLPGSEPAIDSPAAATPRDPTLVLGGGTIFYLVECNEAVAECGEALAEAGERTTPPGYVLVNKDGTVYSVSVVPAEWPYYLYIGGAVYPDTAIVDPKRKDEFEDLCLKICPAQQHLVILIEYS